MSTKSERIAAVVQVAAALDCVLNAATIHWAENTSDNSLKEAICLITQIYDEMCKVCKEVSEYGPTTEVSP